MCCRYYFDAETLREIRHLVHEADRSLHGLSAGDVHPADLAPVITGRGSGGSLRAECMYWGFSRPGKNLRMINARTESVLTKPSFSESVLRRRLVVPVGHFYEWDKDKTQVTFRHPKDPVFYMAGFYNIRENQEQFVILTREANDSMRRVHDRMPLILGKDQIEDWIRDDSLMNEFLQSESPELDSCCEYRQMSLFDL